MVDAQLGAHEVTELLCPSSTCHEGAVVIGLLGADGRLGYLRPAIPVDGRFVVSSPQHGDPESRFRFADNCARDACEHWSGKHCGLVEQLINSPRAHILEHAHDLPRCDIRASCRWFAQDGRAACTVCPAVVYRPADGQSQPGLGSEATGEPVPPRIETTRTGDSATQGAISNLRWELGDLTDR